MPAWLGARSHGGCAGSTGQLLKPMIFMYSPKILVLTPQIGKRQPCGVFHKPCTPQHTVALLIITPLSLVNFGDPHDGEPLPRHPGVGPHSEHHELECSKRAEHLRQPRNFIRVWLRSFADVESYPGVLHLIIDQLVLDGKFPKTFHSNCCCDLHSRKVISRKWVATSQAQSLKDD